MSATATENRPSWRFAYLLGSLFLLILLHPLLAGHRWGPVLLDIFLSLVVIASVFAVSKKTATRILFALLMVPVLVARWLLYLVPNDWVLVLGLGIGSAYIALVAARILLYVIKQQSISTETILAALSVYLLFGLSWGMIYAIIEQLSPRSFAFPATQLSADLLRELVYFSLTTLTTVGYGDTTPITPVAQGFSNLKAVLGQIYLAVLVLRPALFEEN